MVLRTAFTELVGCQVPIQQAGMGGVAKPELAAAVADAGGLGMVSLLPLLESVLGAVDVPVVAAGGIATARGVAAVLAAGAAGRASAPGSSPPPRRPPIPPTSRPCSGRRPRTPS